MEVMTKTLDAMQWMANQMNFIDIKKVDKIIKI
jgi:hypothetical protein